MCWTKPDPPKKEYKVERENQGLREQKKMLNVKKVKKSIEDQCVINFPLQL